MATYKKVTLLALAASFSSTAFAFRGVTVPADSSSRQAISKIPKTSRLHALIYGWDGMDDSDNSGDTSSASKYLDLDSDFGQACSPVGSAVAEALSYDQNRAGHLARLAVAFSPPERALSLDQLEKVDVICVREDHIEIEAVLCDGTTGCVSLSVPVKFPRDCYAASSISGDMLQSCVVQNLEELDQQAGSLLNIHQETKARDDYTTENFEELCALNGSVENFPSWWVPPECDATLAKDCETIRQLLNSDEFQVDVNALAQDSLRKLGDTEHFKVLQAKVAIVGPAGICFKVRAEYELAQDRPTHILDVVYPFGGQPLTSVDALRAAVLGAVAAAEGY